MRFERYIEWLLLGGSSVTVDDAMADMPFTYNGWYAMVDAMVEAMVDMQ